MMVLIRTIVFTLAVMVSLPSMAQAQSDGKHALLFSKSTGFEHQPVSEKNGTPNQVAGVLGKLFETRGITFTASKDAGILNAKDLAKFSLIVFYTQGDFSVPGVDGAPSMNPGGVEALVEWIHNGGGFVGYHSATDTLRSNANEPATLFTKTIGAAFLSHGRQFRGTVRVVDSKHPTMRNIPDGLDLLDEWYLFQQMNTEDIHVLATLEPGPEREKQAQYDVASYPIAWCRELGQGRVFYNAMGHRADVWENEVFLNSLEDAIDWAGGKGASGAKPNYDKVVGSD